MIEIICNGDDENKSEGNQGSKNTSGKSVSGRVDRDAANKTSNKMTSNKNGTNKYNSNRNTINKNTLIRRPKNIKQIGDVSSDRKIYIEDYAFTYINSIAYGEPEEEQAGVLLGEYQKTDDEKCVFIKGVIRAKNVEEGSQGICFDEKMWSNIYAEIDKYFPNLQVVGWFAAMPNVTPERMQYVKRVHLDNFAGSMKTLYLLNTMEKEESFYLYENGDLKQQKGYVCFYERNYEMQEYMLEKRGNKSTEQQGGDEVMSSIRKVIQEKEESHRQRKNSTLMYSAGAFLVILVLVIGINMLNSYEKMKNLDRSINSIANQISDIGGKDDSVNVANQDVTTSQDMVTVNKLDGNVYPTEETTVDGSQTTADASNTTAAPTEAATTQAEPAAATEPAYETHIVETGETIMSICKKHYGSAAKYFEVIEFNHLDDPDKLYVGQEIKLP